MKTVADHEKEEAEALKWRRGAEKTERERYLLHLKCSTCNAPLVKDESGGWHQVCGCLPMEL
jgi:hypothetical protein